MPVGILNYFLARSFLRSSTNGAAAVASVVAEGSGHRRRPHATAELLAPVVGAVWEVVGVARRRHKKSTRLIDLFVGITRGEKEGGSHDHHDSGHGAAADGAPVLLQHGHGV